MAVGDAVVSVYGGSADRQTFPLYPAPSPQVTVSARYDANTQALFTLYEKVRILRGDSARDATAVENLLHEIQTIAADEWLLLFEGIELAQQVGLAQEDYAPLVTGLRSLCAGRDEQRTCLINYGLQRLGLK